MIATDDRFVINRKIENIIITKGLSSSHFADEINVPRSSISHILANRNKPSLEIIHKIIKKYPDISFDWLMNGVEDNNNESSQTTVNQVNSRYKRAIQPDLEFDKKNNPESITTRSNVGRYKSRLTERTQPNSTLSNDNEVRAFEANTLKNKQVARVMIFYTDNTFDTFESK